MMAVNLFKTIVNKDEKYKICWLVNELYLNINKSSHSRLIDKSKKHILNYHLVILSITWNSLQITFHRETALWLRSQRSTQAWAKMECWNSDTWIVLMDLIVCLPGGKNHAITSALLKVLSFLPVTSPNQILFTFMTKTCVGLSLWNTSNQLLKMVNVKFVMHDWCLSFVYWI